MTYQNPFVRPENEEDEEVRTWQRMQDKLATR